MRVCLFDWNGGGHNPGLMLRFAEALAPDVDVVLAAPDSELEQVGESPFERYSLGEARPRPARPGSYRRENQVIPKREMAREELAMLERAARETEADHLVLTYADPVLRWLAGWEPLPAPHSILVMKPRAHYPSLYDTRLSLRERASAVFQERLAFRWSGRPDAASVFTMDPGAARRWSDDRRCKTRAVWLPDSAPSLPATAGGERSGCLMFGYLEPRKGVGLLASALAEDAAGLRLVVAGSAAPEYGSQLEEELGAMRDAGVQVDARLRRIPDAEAAAELAAARCVVLPYVDHYGSSGILAEAAAAGTPVVATDKGLLGYLVRRYELGIAVDPVDPRALREAILELTEGPEHGDRFAAGMRRYLDDHSPQSLRAAVRTGVGIE